MPVGPNRRAFVAGLGGAAAWPIVARAQQSKVSRVGYLSLGSSTDAGNLALFEAFRLKLQDLGYAEGKNLRIDLRRGEGDPANLPILASELVSLSPDVIVGGGSAPTPAIQRATASIPIVMSSVGDPIGNGFIKSLAKPGGNITGVANLSRDLTAKSLELLHAVVPNAQRIAVLMLTPAHEAMLKEAYAGAGALGLTIIPIRALTPADFENAFTTMHNENCDALVVLADPRISRKLVELAMQWKLPAMYSVTGFVEMGGLLSYSPNNTELQRQAAIYVDKILRGANPADLPVEQATRVELQVNVKTAKTLGLTIPDSILARADEVIE
jgi:putative tryptophan/tyrosine transport system substrate-binding protein